MVRLTQSIFNEMARCHEEYLTTNGAEGKKADFSNCKLRGLLLDNVDLRGASFRNTDLGYCTLNNVDLRNCDLSGVILCQTRMTLVNLDGGIPDFGQCEV